MRCVRANVSEVVGGKRQRVANEDVDGNVRFRTLTMRIFSSKLPLLRSPQKKPEKVQKTTKIDKAFSV